MDQAMTGWQARVAAETTLERRGRTLDADVLIEVGDKAWLAAIRRGQVVALQRGPFVLPAFTLALRVTAEGMARFLAPAPVPGWHDLLALRHQGALRIEGDTTIFFAHLAWFKIALALLRQEPAHPPPRPRCLAEPSFEPGRYLRMDIEGRPHRVYVEEAGEGTPLLLLHTAGSDGRQWRDLLNDAEITRRFRCIAFDMPWHGESFPARGLGR